MGTYLIEIHLNVKYVDIPNEVESDIGTTTNAIRSTEFAQESDESLHKAKIFNKFNISK